jgi:protein tyrosine phosphatase type 4A
MRYHLFNEKLNDSNRNFIISGIPNNLDEFINILYKNSINLVINLTGDKDIFYYELLKKNNIDYLHFPLDDGTTPSDEKIKNLINILSRYNSILFHCVAGLGRAPLMFGITLLLLYNYKPLEIIEKIRLKEAKALNLNQVKYLLNFKKKKYINTQCVIS